MAVSSSTQTRTQNHSMTSKCLRTFFLILGMSSLCRCQTYEDAKRLFSDKLNTSVYNVDVRPLNNQSRIMNVSVYFLLLSVVEVNDVSQSFVCNGFLSLIWNDERFRWNSSNYGGITYISPQNVNIWKPRVVIMNTIDERDLFEDDHSPCMAFDNGTIAWSPGSVFSTSCQLDLAKFPFDRQSCSIIMAGMMHNVFEMQFFSGSSEAGLLYFSPSGEWELVSSEISTSNRNSSDDFPLPLIDITFNLKRRPTVLMVTIILPIILLSLLNLLVFFIPVDSGEKIGYGITGLLALTVFMSTVSEMMPSASTTIPYVTIYIFSLLILSLLTVVQSLIIVHLHHKEEKEEKHIKAKQNFKQIFKKFVNVAVNQRNRVSETQMDHGVVTSGHVDIVHTFTGSMDNDEKNSLGHQNEEETRQQPQITETKKEKDKRGEDNNKSKGNKYKRLIQYIDLISFWTFLALWTTCSFAFVIAISS